MQYSVVVYGVKVMENVLYTHVCTLPVWRCVSSVPAGVNRISYWPADPEISLQNEASNPTTTGDAKLDAKAVERLKSNSRARVCVLLQPLVCYMVQFVEETSNKCDFIQKIAKTLSGCNTDFYTECRQERIKEYENLFLISNEEMHKQILMTMGLENLCENPYFSNLRQNMKDLILLLATVAASVPTFGHFGFYCNGSQQSNEIHHQSLPQEIARHCMIQARLLAYRTGELLWEWEKASLVIIKGLEVRSPDCKTLPIWPWARYLTALCLSYYISKVRVPLTVLQWVTSLIFVKGFELF